MTDFLDVGTSVAAHPELLDQLMDLFEGMTDTVKLADVTVDEGAQTPDDRTGWTIVGAYMNGHDSPTQYWLHPDDEPDTQVD